MPWRWVIELAYQPTAVAVDVMIYGSGSVAHVPYKILINKSISSASTSIFSPSDWPITAIGPINKSYHPTTFDVAKLLLSLFGLSSVCLLCKDKQ